MGCKLKLRKASLTLVMYWKLDFSWNVSRVTMEWLPIIGYIMLQWHIITSGAQRYLSTMWSIKSPTYTPTQSHVLQNILKAPPRLPLPTFKTGLECLFDLKYGLYLNKLEWDDKMGNLPQEFCWNLTLKLQFFSSSTLYIIKQNSASK